MKRPYQVQIAGQTLSMRSEDGERYLGDLANSIEGRLETLLGSKRGPLPTRALLLLAMELADELYREKDLHQRFRTKVERRIEDLEQALSDHEQLLARPDPNLSASLDDSLDAGPSSS